MKKSTENINEVKKLQLENTIFEVLHRESMVIYGACALSDGKVIFDGNSRTDVTSMDIEILGSRMKQREGRGNKYVYYMRGGYIWQYEAHTMKLIGYLCSAPYASMFGF